MSPLRREWRTDLAYFFMGHVLVQFILIAVTASTGTDRRAGRVPGGQGRLIQSLPVWAQFLLAVLVADLAQALLHRAYHNIPWLWRFHAVHHSTRRMDWLAGSRIHLLEIVLTRSAVLLPLVVLGFAPAAVNAYVILVGLQAVLAHANLRLRFRLAGIRAGHAALPPLAPRAASRVRRRELRHPPAAGGHADGHVQADRRAANGQPNTG
jgi:sterol desaturase/sphingolipid hydroxylase (fatty acid hydroxylase superfamily)